MCCCGLDSFAGLLSAMQGCGLDIYKRTVSSLKARALSRRKLKASAKARQSDASSDSPTSWTILSETDGQTGRSSQKPRLSSKQLKNARLGLSNSQDPSTTSSFCYSEKKGEHVIQSGCSLLGSCFNCPCSPSEWYANKTNPFGQKSATRDAFSEGCRKKPVAVPPSRIPRASQIPPYPNYGKKFCLKWIGYTASVLHMGKRDPESKIPSPPKANMEASMSESAVADFSKSSGIVLDSIFFYDIDYFQFLEINTEDFGAENEASLSSDSFQSEAAPISLTWTVSSIVDVIEKKMPELPPMAVHQPTMESRERSCRRPERFWCTNSRLQM